nr:oxysterol-binding protein-related protein 4C-like [Tanacetum cinerariifolium]
MSFKDHDVNDYRQVIKAYQAPILRQCHHPSSLFLTCLNFQVNELTAVLTAPLSLDTESVNGSPNLLHRIFSLLKNVRPGSDLTRFTLPPIFNIPKSQLQCYGESVYSVNNDILSRCANGGTPLERFTSVVAWSISTLRPLMFGVAPFNPILGETHHVSRGNLNVLLEQVSHHPPVSALHATNEKDNIEMTWCQYAIPKFNGASIETRVLGKRQLKLLNHGETYVMNSPNLVIKFLPVPDVEWLGNVTIRCQESGLEAELCFKGKPFLGRHSNYRSIRGKIVSLSKMETIYEISGHWDRNVTIKETSNGKLTVIYSAKDVISALKTPIVKDVEVLISLHLR